MSERTSFSKAAMLLAVALAARPAVAQAPVGAVAGVVTDASGALLRGATVTATSLSTGATRTAVTNDQGYFLVPSLKPGSTGLRSPARDSATSSWTAWRSRSGRPRAWTR